MTFIINILVSAVAVLIAANLLPGVHVDSFITSLLVALVLAFMNAIVKPIFTILTIPITIFSFGLFLLVINAGIIILTDKLVDGFSVNGFWWALFFSFIVSVTTGILNMFLGNKKENEE
ncbi:MAG: phage holin family protein [Bacteroidia bacterium]|nr:phage holin family protein [Bacteroidia bacterium]